MTAALLALALAASPFAARCDATLAEAEAVPAAQLREVLGTLPPPRVAGHAGSLPTLDAAAEALGDAPTAEKREAALATLRALCAQAHAADAAAASVDADALREILQQPQFAQRRGQEWALLQLLDRLWDLIKELLQQKTMQRFSTTGRALFLIAVGAIAAVLARRVWLNRRQEREAQRPAQAQGVVRREVSVDELVAMAQAALDRGDAREAVRAQMRAVLIALADKGLTDRRGAATNREVARELARRGDAELARLTAELAGRFDRAIYGGASLDRSAASAFAEDAAALRARVGASP